MKAAAASRSAAILAIAIALLPSIVHAQRWQVRREMREGVREIGRERREAMRELSGCVTRQCARREIREGYREVSRERREARREVRGEAREAYYDRYYRGEGRWYRDGRDWDRYDYERRYYYRDRNSGDDVLTGVVIGAAVVGAAAVIADSDD